MNLIKPLSHNILKKLKEICDTFYINNYTLEPLKIALYGRRRS